MMVRKSAYIFLFFFLFTAAGCSRSFEAIRDIRELPQDHRFYVATDDAYREILPADRQIRLQQRYNRAYFSPWHQTASAYRRDDVEGFFLRYLRRAEGNGTKGAWRKPFCGRLARNARLEGFPNTAIPAITIRYADMRGLPTHRALRSQDVRSQRSSPAFDRLQVSSIPANTPVFISQFSRDRKWCLAETGFAIGWLMIRDVAVVDADVIRQWEKLDI